MQINNAGITGRAINPVTYQGARVSALWDINADWNALITQSYQNIDAQGVFYQMPNGSDGEPLPKQSVTLFNDSFNKDKFENTAWTSTAGSAICRAVYTGSYLVRNISQVAGLHQLLARPVRRLLPVPRRGADQRPAGCDLLFAERHLERDRARHAPESRTAPQHAR